MWINIDFPDVIVCREKYIPVGRLEMTISKRPAIMMRSCISALITAGAWPQNAAMLVEERPFFGVARKQLKKKLKLYTRIAMKVVDEGDRRGFLTHLRG